MQFKRRPHAVLRTCVRYFWASDESPTTSVRESSLPTGDMHLAFRLSGGPVRVFASATDEEGATLGCAVVGGSRSRYFLREAAAGAISVGAVLQPGAAWALWGIPADEIAGHHTRLEDLWGARARELLGRLADCADASGRVDILERALVGGEPLMPAMAQGVKLMRAGAPVEEAVRQSGLSHRHFIERFRRAVGLGPAEYRGVLRFQRAVRALAGAQDSLVAVALDSGYCDQPQFQRDFLARAGMTPAQYRQAAPSRPQHVKIVQDLATRAGEAG